MTRSVILPDPQLPPQPVKFPFNKEIQAVLKEITVLL